MGREERWRAPAMIAAAMMVHSGDRMARGMRKGTGTQGAKPCWWMSNGEVTGRAVPAVIASIADHGRGERADKRGPPAGERAIKRGRAGAAVGQGRAVSGRRGRAGGGPSWASGERAEVGVGKDLGWNRPNRGERNSFSFCFSYFQVYFTFSSSIISFPFE
jgi:hypothetical protein